MEIPILQRKKAWLGKEKMLASEEHAGRAEGMLLTSRVPLPAGRIIEKLPFSVLEMMKEAG